MDIVKKLAVCVALTSLPVLAQDMQIEYKILAPKMKLSSKKTTTTASRSSISIPGTNPKEVLPDDTDVSHRELFKNQYNSGLGLGAQVIFPANPYLSWGTGLKYTSTEMVSAGLEKTIFDGDASNIGVLSLQEFARSSWNFAEGLSSYVQGGLSAHQIYAGNQSVSQYEFPEKSYKQTYSPIVSYDLAVGFKWSFESWALGLEFEGSNTLINANGRLRSKQVRGFEYQNGVWIRDFTYSYQTKIEGLKMSTETVALSFIQKF